MSRKENQLTKIVKILETVKMARGEENGITTNDFIKKLAEDDIPCDRRTLDSNIKELIPYVEQNKHYNFQIRTGKRKSANIYYSELKEGEIDKEFTHKDLVYLAQGIRNLELFEDLDSEKCRMIYDKILANAPEKKRKLIKDYISDEKFALEMADSRLLIDSVKSLKSLKDKDKQFLVDVIIRLTDSDGREALKKESDKNPITGYNSSFSLIGIDALENAIINNEKAEFRYFDLGVDETKNYRYNGQPKTVEPIKLERDGNNYYLICHCEGAEKDQKSYRIDKMDDIKHLEGEKISDAAQQHKDNYAEDGVKISMYGGRTEEVTLVLDRKFVQYIKEKCSENNTELKIEGLGNDMCRASFNTQISPTFFSWVFQFGDKMKIEGPESVVNECRERLQSIMGLY